MGVKPEDIARAIAGGNRVLAQLKKVCPKSEHKCPGCGASTGEICDEWCKEIGKVKTKKRIRQDKKPLLNKLETEFKDYYSRITGHTLIPQAIRFRLANGTWYKPDFLIFCDVTGVTAIEVKGPHAFRGGFENLKIAAGLYQSITWKLFWKENQAWMSQTVLP